MLKQIRLMACAAMIAVVIPVAGHAALLKKFSYFGDSFTPNYTFGTTDKRNDVFSKFSFYLKSHSVTDLAQTFLTTAQSSDSTTTYSPTVGKTFLVAANEAFRVKFKEAKDVVVLKWKQGGTVVKSRFTGTTAVPGPIAGAGLPLLLCMAGFMFYRSRKTTANGEMAAAV